MPYERRPDRRPGGGRPSGSGRPPGDRPSYGDRPARDRPSYGDRPARDRGEFGDRPPRDRGFNADAPRPARPAGFAPRPMDDGGMSIRLDPRRLGALKLLAAEAGLRPGELVTSWVEERLDAARAGGMPAATAATAAPDALAALTARIDELARRLDTMATLPATAVPEAVTPQAATPEAATPIKRGRGRPRKVAEAGTAKAPAVTRAKRAPRRSATTRRRSTGKVALHDEIAAVITERGPQTAAELASAIVERGNYRPPRSAKPLDAAAVNARVSNPTYRGRFLRRERRIGLAAE